MIDCTTHPKAFAPVSMSRLKAMALSPRHFLQACMVERADSDAMALGRLDHAMVFEPESIDSRYVVWDGGRRAGKAWDAFVAENDGKEILRAPEDWEAAEGLAAAVRAHPVAADLLQAGSPEVHRKWRDVITGVDCHGYLDWHDPGRRLVVDLKTTRDISERAIQRSVTSLAYHAQAAFYLDGVGASRFYWIFAEQHQPWDVAVYEASPATIDAGRSLYRQWLRRLAECRRTGEWPGTAPELKTLVLPTWAAATETELVLTMGGQEVQL